MCLWPLTYLAWGGINAESDVKIELLCAGQTMHLISIMKKGQIFDPIHLQFMYLIFYILFGSFLELHSD